MNKKIIVPFLFVALTVSCMPAPTAVPSETAVSMSTFTPVPLRDTQSVPPFATIAPTLTPANEVPTSGPTGSLTANGPWLLYVHNSPLPGMPGSDEVPPEFILLNQDGSGRTSITLPACYGQVSAFLMEGGNSDNYMAQYVGGLYLFRPLQVTGMRVYGQSWYTVCNTFFTGDEKSGLLASFYRSADDATPELIIFELPSGNIRDRFPLVRCGENANVCEEFRANWGQMMQQAPQWSPNGHYLAFTAVLDAASSDLFVYDAQDGSLRRLTNGPDWVGPIEWSPDGTQIIMQELLNDADFFFDPVSKPPTSVWSVSVNSNEIKLLYSTDGASAQQTILQWLDDQRFVAYEGFLVNADVARNLRLVDLKAGTNRILFDSMFGSASFDPIHETIALYTFDTEKYRQGTYLVSIENSTIRRLEGSESLSFPEWDEKTGLFVASENCQNDPNGFQAFDYQGNSRCVTELTPTPGPLEPARYPAPDGKWSASVKDGLWLEAEGQAAIQVSEEKVSELIWCPDSSCLFFSVTQADQQWTLYHVSLPDLTIKMVDEGIQSTGSYQWLGGEK